MASPSHQFDSSEFSLSIASDEEVEQELEHEGPSELFSSPEPNTAAIEASLKEFAIPTKLTLTDPSHELQLLKIELSQKTMALNNQKMEYQGREEGFKETITGLQHQVQLLQHKLEADLQLQQSRSHQLQNKLRQELDDALTRHRQIEERNEHLLSQATQLKRLFQGDLEISEEQYEDIRSFRKEKELGVRDFILCRLYETMLPLRKEMEDLKRQISVIEEERDRCIRETDGLATMLDHERDVHSTLQRDYQKVLAELADVKTQVQSGNYKIEHFDRVQEERNHLESVNATLRDQWNTLEIDHANVVRDREEELRKLSEARQTLTLLQQDKDYLTKQITELSHRCITAEERSEAMSRQVDEMREAREELYEKYVRCRDEYKSQYENQLRDELEKLRMKTDHEIDRLKVGQRELFERENLSLREQRDIAMEAQEKAVEHARDLETRLDRLRQELIAQQSSQDNRIAELLAQCKVRAFEAQRAGLLYEEAKTQMQHTLEDSEKLRTKLEVLTKEYYQMESSLGKRINGLDQQLSECQRKLQVYERLEDELDSAVMQAAEIADSKDPYGDAVDAEKILFSYAGGAGAQLPSQAKRRMRQSVELARRVLQLERRCAELKKQNDEWEQRYKESVDELSRVNQILNDSQQPYGYLIDSLRNRDSSIQNQQKLIAELKEKLALAKKDRATIIKVKNQMAADLERLLSQREELFMLKQLFAAMKENSSGDQRRPTKQAGGFPGFSMTKEEKEPPNSSRKPQRSSASQNPLPYGLSLT